MTAYQTSLAVADFITLISLFSTVGGLLYLALIGGWFPLPGAINWQAGLVRFAFSVASGVVTYFVTNQLFGHGTDDASLTGIATAAVIGTVTQMTS